MFPLEKSKIITILNDWNFWIKPRETGIPRQSYINKMEALKNTGQIVTISGVRRSGKSTLMLQYIKSLIDNGLEPRNTLYVNLEDPRWGELSIELLQTIWEAYLEWLEPHSRPFIFLDEVQLIPGWEKFARALHERNDASLFISGSSSKLLSTEFGTVLTGRHVSLSVYPLNFKEFLLFRDIELQPKLELMATDHRAAVARLLREYIEWGGFPAVVLSLQKRVILTQYYEDVLSRDIVTRYKIRKPHKLKALARYYITNSSALISYNRTKKFLEMSLDTVERFSDYLTHPYLIFFVNKFSYSLKEQAVNPRKVYCIDSGLRNTVSLRVSEDAGKLYENIVFLQLLRQEKEIFYWKDKTECDFLVRDARGPEQAIQVCYTLTEDVMKREIKGLSEAMDTFGLKSGIVITQDYEKRDKHHGKTIRFIPLWKWLCQ